jgi:hypothetical protein
MPVIWGLLINWLPPVGSRNTLYKKINWLQPELSQGQLAFWVTNYLSVIKAYRLATCKLGFLGNTPCNLVLPLQAF